MAIHDPAKVITDLAVSLAIWWGLFGRCALRRAAAVVFGPVASDPTESRTIGVLATDAARALKAIGAARAAARARAWR